MLINVSLSKEQAALLLPLIPKLDAQASPSATTSEAVSDKPCYAINEIFVSIAIQVHDALFLVFDLL